ncbi:transposable element Tc1 transposase [Trichonephila clavipes]|nr:transposable element Tc1 transposase [Trichonephila clavipes]
MINGHTRLHVVANGTMTGQRYIDEVLLPHVPLFRGAVGDEFVFMDDNATCHRTLAVQDCLDSEGIQRLVWPARSPDLNPIENVWDALGRQVASRNYPPTNKNTLIRALTEEWDKLPQQLLDNVVQMTSPICVLCDTGQDMTAAHLDECSALNDLNCIVKRSSTVHEVCVRVTRPFSKSRESMSDIPRSGRLVTSVSDENIEKARKSIPTKRQLAVRMIADELQIDCESVRQIVTQNLGMRKMCY